MMEPTRIETKQRERAEKMDAISLALKLAGPGGSGKFVIDGRRIEVIDASTLGLR